MNRYKLIISYDGTDYAGWQVQETGFAIQPVIQKALETILRHPLDLTGSGRTDAGVHALGQTAHFDTAIPVSLGKLRLSLNALLPPDIRIMDIEEVGPTFHARYTAQSKIYHYHLHLGTTHDPFTRLYRYRVHGSLNWGKIHEAIPHFLGIHDFTSFANEPGKGSASRDPVRTLLRLDCIPQAGGIRLEFEATGFLYKMVRNITGTLIDIGAGRMQPDEIPSIFEAKDRRRAGASAPPQGLFLVKVLYPNSSISKIDSK